MLLLQSCVVAETLLITGCKQLVTLRGDAPKRGRALRELGIVKDGAVLVSDGEIAAVGTRASVEAKWKKLPPKTRKQTRQVEAAGVALPGFVDSHTHLVFPASRADEYEMRIAGASYEEIAHAGGGILSTVRKLRRADRTTLATQARQSLEAMAAHGTTTVEAKSGYGLDAKNEIKILKVLAALHAKQGVEVVPTFMGAHVAPPEFHDRADDYVDFVCRKLIPHVASHGLARYCDVFCERGAFTVEQARRILTAARACGLGLRIHAEQLTRTGAAQLAVELHAASADHLEQINSDDIRALAESDVTCTLLPGCCFHLGLQHYAPARALIDAGAIVALATDFNPGTSPTLNMQMILSLACTQMRMTPAEAIAAATINAAYSLGRADRIGSLEVGKQADIAVFDVEDYRESPYYFGVNHCRLTLKRGRAVWKAH